MEDFTFEDTIVSKDSRFTETFSFRQIGSITSVVEPMGTGSTIENLEKFFLENPQIQAIPVEKNGSIIGILDKRTVDNLNSSAWTRFWQKEIDEYASKSIIILQANDFIEKNMDTILSENKNHDTKFFCVYHQRSFLGIVGLHDFLQRITDIRKQDMSKAHAVQQHLLEGVETADKTPFYLNTWNKMANEVGGDFFKCFCIEKNKKYIVACFDVSGKNVAAALSTIAIGSFFSALRHLNSPVQFGPPITAMLDAYIQDITPMGMFITAAICYIDYEKNTVSVQNCGHTPIYIFEPNRETKKILIKTMNPNVPPLGMGAIAENADTDEDLALILPIQNHLRIALYSDGLTDMQTPEGLRFEDERTKQLLTETYTKRGDEFTRTIDKTVKEWVLDAMLIDDITIMDLHF